MHIMRFRKLKSQEHQNNDHKSSCSNPSGTPVLLFFRLDNIWKHFLRYFTSFSSFKSPLAIYFLLTFISVELTFLNKELLVFFSKM
ncbi:hypothetical protein TNCT_609931 [Trichonephila clavata]|uniref:Uncharacterized protein n=1 Tax=Trichonephila clavata TaxID=2740835 RepID=A0A8X6FN14_TRICU|nr:hypothetical protein TNCT_609931 [Trichonephila clavata]